MIIDEIDSLCPDRSKGVSEEDRQIVGAVLTAIDGKIL